MVYCRGGEDALKRGMREAGRDKEGVVQGFSLHLTPWETECKLNHGVDPTSAMATFTQMSVSHQLSAVLKVGGRSLNLQGKASSIYPRATFQKRAAMSL